MPMIQQSPPSPTAISRCEDELHEEPPTTERVKKLPRRIAPGDDGELMMDITVPPGSPRVRKRLDEAKENASVFGPVCEQGEVIQWMTACHSGLVTFGRDLERRGFKTLSSIAFLTEEDLDPSIEPAIRQLLLATLARLRHEFFRM